MQMEGGPVDSRNPLEYSYTLYVYAGYNNDICAPVFASRKAPREPGRKPPPRPRRPAAPVPHRRAARMGMRLRIPRMRAHAHTRICACMYICVHCELEGIGMLRAMELARLGGRFLVQITPGGPGGCMAVIVIRSGKLSTKRPRARACVPRDDKYGHLYR